MCTLVIWYHNWQQLLAWVLQPLANGQAVEGKPPDTNDARFASQHLTSPATLALMVCVCLLQDPS